MQVLVKITSFLNVAKDQSKIVLIILTWLNFSYSTGIWNNEVCLYLATKKLVNEMTADKSFIKIDEIQVNIWPLISKQQRVIFLNVAWPIQHFEPCRHFKWIGY